MASDERWSDCNRLATALGAILALAWSSGLAAQEIGAARTSEPIEVDGVLDEAAWDGAASIETFTQLQPVAGAPASQRTVIRILYDERMVYFGIESRDTDPDAISRTVTRRDGEVWEDDAVALVLDTFDDDNNAYVFMVNSLGTQQDERWADNGRTRDITWDANWLSAGTTSDRGWTAEVAIPFETVRFARETTTWGFNAIRYLPRNLEQSHWIPGLSEWFRIDEIGSITDLDLTEAVTKSYAFIPYLQGALQETQDATTEFGLDLRYAPSSNIGIDFSFNPDFATVEADVEQVNLTRYELSYPEKRPFFLEGTESYRTRIVQFYSRRIGDMQWGAKVNGKVGKWRVNGLASQTDSETVTSSAGPGALYSAFRLSREIGGASNVGVIGANRTFDGTSEGSVGLVGTLFFSDYLGMTSQVIRSYGAHDEGAWTYFFRPSYDSQTGHFHVRYTHVGENVRENMNRVGFIRDDDRREVDSNVRKQFWINRSGLQDLTGSINYNQFWSQSGRLRSWKISNRVGLNFLRRWSLDLTNDEEFKAEEPGLFEKDFRNSLNQAKLTFDTRTGTSVSAYYGRGLNFDSDLDQFGGSRGLDDHRRPHRDLRPQAGLVRSRPPRPKQLGPLRASDLLPEQGHVLQGVLPDPLRRHRQPLESDVRAGARDHPAPLRLEVLPPVRLAPTRLPGRTRPVRRRTSQLPHPLHQTLLGVLSEGEGTAGLQTGTTASRVAPHPHGADGLERRSPTGIARERETSADDAAPCRGGIWRSPRCDISCRPIAPPCGLFSGRTPSKRP